MFTAVKPSATTMAAAALLLLLLAASSSSVESADECSASVYRTCRFAASVANPGVAVDRCCDGVGREYCYCDAIRRIRADRLDEGAVWCLRGATCTQSSLRGSESDDS